MRAGGGAVFEAAANVEHADHQLLGHLLMIQLLTCAQVAEFSPAVDVQGVPSVFEAESNNIAGVDQIAQREEVGWNMDLICRVDTPALWCQ